MPSIILSVMIFLRKITLWRIKLRLVRFFPSKIDRFISEVPGLIHVGANDGGERDKYAKYGLGVLWIEPNPSVFTVLKKNISHFSGQIAYQRLITDRDNQQYDFHIANNAGLSSSILQLKLHSELNPEVRYIRTIKMRSCTLTTLLKEQSICVSDYPALILDTQGSEMLVLQGAIDVLHLFWYVKIEVADFEAYEGCCQISEVCAFMKIHGFYEVDRRKFAEHFSGGSYFDVLFKLNH